MGFSPEAHFETVEGKTNIELDTSEAFGGALGDFFKFFSALRRFHDFGYFEFFRILFFPASTSAVRSKSDRFNVFLLLR